MIFSLIRIVFVHLCDLTFKYIRIINDGSIKSIQRDFCVCL